MFYNISNKPCYYSPLLSYSFTLAGAKVVKYHDIIHEFN